MSPEQALQALEEAIPQHLRVSRHGEGFLGDRYETIRAFIASSSSRSEEVARLREALEHIVRRLQMDIDDGGRPDQWSMEDLVRKARSALKENK